MIFFFYYYYFSNGAKLKVILVIVAAQSFAFLLYALWSGRERGGAGRAPEGSHPGSLYGGLLQWWARLVHEEAAEVTDPAAKLGDPKGCCVGREPELS